MNKFFNKSIIMISVIMLVVLANISIAVADEVTDDVDELLDRVDALELKAAKNKVSIFGDFRVKYDYLKFQYQPYNQYMGGDPMSPSSYMPIPAYELKNNENWSLKLRLKIDAKPSPTLHFTGRLVMHQTYGGSGVPIFNGFPNTVAYDANATNIPTDNTLRVERAAFTYSPENSDFFFTAGRQAATNGPPRELREDRVRQGTPGGLMIDAEIDGIMIGLRLDDAFGLPEGARFRFCYGTGFEAGFGGGGAVATTYVPGFDPMSGASVPLVVSELKDSKVAGGCAETSIPQLPGKTLLTLGYMRFIDMTDISTGYTRNFPNPADGNTQLVTSTRNLGDMDLFGVCFQQKVSDIDWFASLSIDKSYPDVGAVSQYGFGGLLGNPNESETGMAYYVGTRFPVKALDGKFGLEYNHGDEHWFSYTNGADDIAMSKLATKGSVIEAYYIQKIEKKFNIRAGIQAYDYDYAFSGWHIAPGPMSMFELDKNPSLAYAFPDKITNVYVVFDLDF